MAVDHRGYLLDTSVISILAPGREPHVPAGMVDWLHARSSLLFIPSVAIAELTQGICKLRRAGGVERAARLAAWLDGMVAGYGDRILPIDSAVARLAGGMSEAAMAKGKHPGFADVAIAATAQHAGLLLLTCNLKHFEPLNVACCDPVIRLPD